MKVLPWNDHKLQWKKVYNIDPRWFCKSVLTKIVFKNLGKTNNMLKNKWKLKKFFNFKQTLKVVFCTFFNKIFVIFNSPRCSFNKKQKYSIYDNFKSQGIWCFEKKQYFDYKFVYWSIIVGVAFTKDIGNNGHQQKRVEYFLQSQTVFTQEVLCGRE